MKNENIYWIVGIVILALLILPKLDIGLFSVWDEGILPEGQYNEYGDCEFLTNINPITARYNSRGSGSSVFSYGNVLGWVSIDYDNDGDLDSFGSCGTEKATGLTGVELILLVENYNHEGDDMYYYQRNSAHYLFFTNENDAIGFGSVMELGCSTSAITSCEGICVPKTCSDLNKECGSWTDGCGNEIDCGTCGIGYSCYYGECIYYGVPDELTLEIQDINVDDSRIEFFPFFEGGTPLYKVLVDLGNGDEMDSGEIRNPMGIGYDYGIGGTFDIEICVVDSKSESVCETITLTTIGPPELICEDTDGENIYTKGVMTIGTFTYTDYCFHDQVREYSCVDGEFHSELIDCPETCEDGKCVDYPDNGEVPANGDVPTNGEIEEWYNQEVFSIGDFIVKLWMILAAIGGLFLVLIIKK